MKFLRNEQTGRFSETGGIVLFLLTCVMIFVFLPNDGRFGAWSAVWGDNSPESVPSWAEEKIGAAFARFETWRGTDAVIVFPIVTDVHSETTRSATTVTPLPETDWSDPKNHLRIAQRAAVVFGADFLADLGDIGIDRYADYQPSAPEDVFWRMAAQLRLYQDFTAAPVLFALGNHDHGNDGFAVSSRTYGETFNGLTRRRGVPIVTGPDSDYGYYDVPGKACRVFFLNSSDDGYYGFSRNQLQFLADALRLPEGGTVVLCQHFCVDRRIGLWKSASHIKANRGETWQAVLEGFVSGNKGESDGVVWDFTANRNSRLAGCLTGDSHYDNQGTRGGVNSVISQGFGLVQKDQMPEGAVSTPVDLTSDTLIDVAAVKPAKGEMRLFRIGAGGESRDRSVFFPPTE